MEKRRLRVTDGGYAVPLGNNYFLMKGKTHEQGGIGLSDKIEVENNEIVKVPLEDVAGKLKMVSPDASIIRETKLMGISFGD